MRLKILLITEPAEETRLGKSLRGSFQLRLRGDLDEAAPPNEQILREQPDAILLGIGLDEAAAYVEAAREYLPGCSICLLADRAEAEAARRLRPNALFLRPVKLTELLTALDSLGQGRVAPEPQARRATELPRRPATEAPRRPSSAGLLRLDDMLGDPMGMDPMGLLGGAPPRVTEPPRAEPPRAEPPRAEPPRATEPPPAAEPPPEPRAERPRRSLSGQFHQLVVVPEEILEAARPQTREGKVAVDPTLYEDALADIDVDTLGNEEGAAVPTQPLASTLSRAPTAPPPLPADLGAARRRSEPPPPPPTATGPHAVTVPPAPPAVSGSPGAHAAQAAPSGHAAPAAGTAHAASSPPPLPRDATLPRRTTQPPILPPPPPAPVPEATAPPPPPTEGDLQATDPPTLIGWLCTSGYSGCLQLNRDGETAQRMLFFDGGELVAAASALPVDSLPELLYHEGRLSREQLKRARQLLESAGGEVTNRRLAQLLADEQLLPKGEIAPLLRRHVIEIFYRSFAWEKGRYRLHGKTAPPEDRVRLKETPKLLLLEGLRRKASLDSLLARVGPDGTVLRPVASGGLLLKDAGVTAFEQRALPLFDGRHTLLQISRQSGLAEHATYVLAYALICLGGLRRPEAEPPPRPRPSGGHVITADPSARTRPLEPPPPPPDDRAERVARARDRVRRKHAHVVAADYFTLLDLTEMAGADEVRRAHDTLRAELSDELLPTEVGAELGAELGEIREVLGEAYAILSSDELRAAYRAQLLPRPDEAAPAKG